MKNQFVKQFENNIKFTYSCFDRVIVRGYIRRFFSLGVVAVFLKAMGFTKKLKAFYVSSLINSMLIFLRKHQKNNIPILWWPSFDGGKNGAKHQYVARHYSEKFSGEGNQVFCIITDKEPVQTIASKELKSKTGRLFTKFYNARKPVKQYYIYFHDAVLGGPCYLKISSYLPFQSEFYFNGHNYIKQVLDKKGIDYRMKENAIVDVKNPEIIPGLNKELEGRIVKERIDYWMNRFFKFDKGTYSTRSKHLKHEWYLSQVEVCSNVIFKSSKFCTSLFERLLDKFTRIGLPYSIAMLFGKRPARSKSKTSVRLYDNYACLKHWFRGNSIKQYNKTGYFIRTETTINNPKSLGLKKPVLYLQSYLWNGVGSNDRLLNCCSDIDLSTLTDGETDIFTKPVLDNRNNKVTAPDLRKDRQVVLFEELLKPKYLINGFKTVDLKNVLKDHFRNSAQVRYELKKLIARDIIIKMKNKSF